MAYVNTLYKIPKIITVGTSVSWGFFLTDFPASSWDLTYSLTMPGRSISISAVADGDNFLIELPYADTALYKAGVYDYQAHVDNGEERYLVDSGTVTITDDLSTKTCGNDGRTHTKRVLDAIEAVIENRASKTQLTQSAAGVEVQHMTMEQLISARDKYRVRYLNEQVLAGNKKARIIKPRFHS